MPFEGFVELPSLGSAAFSSSSQLSAKHGEVQGQFPHLMDLLTLGGEEEFGSEAFRPPGAGHEGATAAAAAAAAAAGVSQSARASATAATAASVTMTRSKGEKRGRRRRRDKRSKKNERDRLALLEERFGLCGGGGVKGKGNRRKKRSQKQLLDDLAPSWAKAMAASGGAGGQHENEHEYADALKHRHEHEQGRDHGGGGRLLRPLQVRVAAPRPRARQQVEQQTNEHELLYRQARLRAREQEQEESFLGDPSLHDLRQHVDEDATEHDSSTLRALKLLERMAVEKEKLLREIARGRNSCDDLRDELEAEADIDDGAVLADKAEIVEDRIEREYVILVVFVVFC